MYLSVPRLETDWFDALELARTEDEVSGQSALAAGSDDASADHSALRSVVVAPAVRHAKCSDAAAAAVSHWSEA